MLEELRRVLAAATPGMLFAGDAYRSASIPFAGHAYTDEVFAHGAKDPHTPIATYERAEDAARAVAVANALPALLAVADAARELEAATTASLLLTSYGSSIDDGPSRAALWAALEALRATQ